MASIHEEVLVNVSPAQVWDAMRDVGQIHVRLVPGFVIDCRLDGEVRTVTFGNGMVVREPIVDVDEKRRRVSWAAVGEQFAHYNASLQVFDEGEKSRIVWISDFLPHALAETVGAMTKQALATMKQTLERAAPAR
jgi:carbon monoxide dehydrogenase subunit G